MFGTPFDTPWTIGEGPSATPIFADLKRAARRLQAFPEMGREREDGAREYMLRHHVVLYRHQDDTVYILRVMHPRRLRD
ncbi:MAG: type II toxin-antitoxin system RelE/ParE family toxin [Chloroflexia bacterium]|nr:type II toxin-antitoxin system RelE/ParE family toxin [Chloroflexia bacterium]